MIQKKIMEVRKAIAESEIKKTGIIEVEEEKGTKLIEYLQLEDIKPVIDEQFEKLGLYSKFTISENGSQLEITELETGEKETFITSNKIGKEEMSIESEMEGIQKIGSLHTYIRRYLYILAFDIRILEERQKIPKIGINNANVVIEDVLEKRKLEEKIKNAFSKMEQAKVFKIVEEFDLNSKTPKDVLEKALEKINENK